jgi:hypothetical protein
VKSGGFRFSFALSIGTCGVCFDIACGLRARLFDAVDVFAGTVVLAVLAVFAGGGASALP